jgi:hypothetical protein
MFVKVGNKQRIASVSLGILRQRDGNFVNSHLHQLNKCVNFSGDDVAIRTLTNLVLKE